MELNWAQVGNVGPGTVFVARSVADDRNRYEISGTEGFWYGTYFDHSNTGPGGPCWNLGWAPTLEMMKERCQILDDYKGH